MKINYKNIKTKLQQFFIKTKLPKNIPSYDELYQKYVILKRNIKDLSIEYNVKESKMSYWVKEVYKISRWKSHKRKEITYICLNCKNEFKSKEEDRQFCSQSCASSYNNRIGKSGINSSKDIEASKEKISKANKGRLVGDKNPSKRKDVRKLLSDILTGRDVPWLTRKKRPEHSKFMKNRMKEIKESQPGDALYEIKLKFINNSRKRHSKLHDQIKEWLIKNNIINFISEQNIPNTGIIVDELNKNNKLIFEINGDFWHANPRLFKKDEIIKYPGNKLIEARFIWDRDIRRIKILEKLGYKVFEIWEYDFFNNRDNLLIKIKEFING